MIFERDFPRARGSVPEARRFATAALSSQPERFVGEVALMVSGLATNAIQHGETPFCLRIDTTGGDVLVEVSDNGGGGAARRAPQDEDPSGRGLQVVETLSDTWGTRPGTSARWRQTVWFRLRPPSAVRTA